MFLCLAIEDYKRPHLDGSYTTPGKMASVYRVELDANGRPTWILHAPCIWWACGYGDPTNEKIVKAGVAKHMYQYAGLPYINRAAHHVRVLMSEAAKLVDVNTPASLDRLTELVSESAGVAEIQNFKAVV
jgi:hypothetical protein